jgi:hypothetical protein
VTFRGLIQEPELFEQKNAAEQRREALLNRMNSDYDEIGLFEKTIGMRVSA